MTTLQTDDYRRYSDLNGAWQFVTDPDEVGRERGWAEPGRSWPDRARAVEVPHAWQEREDFRDYAGTAWYRRTVDLETPIDDRAERALLRFGAVDYEATIWVNGDRVGSNRGGYLPFAVDATDALVAGENAIVVEVTDPEDLDEIPHGKQGEPWYQRVSGIWQDVRLERVPATRVEAVRATPDLEHDRVRIDLETTAGARSAADDPADGAAAEAASADAVTATVTVSREGTEVARVDAALETDGTATVTLPIDDPDYWTPETPALYDVRVTLERAGDSDGEDPDDGAVLDRYADYFGMRSVESRNGRIYLNGEPYPIRGALEQGYYPETLYRPCDDDWFETEVRLAKELGFNLLRKHIKPAHPDFLEQADRQGLLVWEEPANPTVHSERSKREVREQLAGMIERDYNRPSVVIWSIYNEEWGIGNPQGLDVETSLWEDETKQAYLADLYEETKRLDPTRLVCDNSGWAHVATDVNDYHRYFVSPDRAAAWASDLDEMLERPEENYAATETDPQDAPIVVSEFGTWGLFDAPALEDTYEGRPPWLDYEFLTEGLKRPAGYRERFAETALADAFDDIADLATAWQRRQLRSNEDVIERMRAREGIAGYVITQFSDIEWEFNGILDYRREPKSFHEEFARLNAPVAVQLDPESRAVRDDGRIAADAIVVNDTTERLEAELTWTAAGESGSRAVAVDPASTVRLADVVAVDAPAVDEVTTETVRLDLDLEFEFEFESGSESDSDSDSDRVLAVDDVRTEEPITVVPRDDADEPIGESAGSLYVQDESLRSSLERRGATVVDRLEAADLAVVSATADPILEFARDGGDVLLLPDEDGRVADEALFDYRELPEGESWNLVASLLYAVDDRLEELLGRVPGWELEGLYPAAVVPAAAVDDVSLGYVEGWLANPAAAIGARDYGAGRIRVCTVRIAGAYGEHPTATVLLETLLTNARGESRY